MEFVVAAVVVAILLLVLMNVRARSIVKRHAANLSRITGIPAQQISQEMIGGNQTPGEWAVRHGLDPMTFARVINLETRLAETIAREHPQETTIAVSQGQLESGGPVAVAATDRAVHSASATEYIRNEYSSINRVNLESTPDGQGQLLVLVGFQGVAALSVYLLDLQSVYSAIESQLGQLTLHAERVELTPDGGAMFRWRKVGDEYLWIVDYDSALIGWDGRPSAEADAASSEAIERLNKHI